MSAYHQEKYGDEMLYQDDQHDEKAALGGGVAGAGRRRNPNRRNLILVCASFFIVLVLAAVIAVAVGLNRRRGADPGDDVLPVNGTSSPTTAPSIAATTASVSTKDWFQFGSTMFGNQQSDLFGRSVCVSHDGAIVAMGAPGRNRNGYVRVYVHDGIDWLPMGNDILGEGGTDFGWSCALSADGLTLAVGDWFNTGETSGIESGHVRVFKYSRSMRQFTQLGDDIDGAVAYDHAGWDVSLSGDGGTLAVGVPGNDAGGDRSGHIRVYVYDDETAGLWNKIGQDIEGEGLIDESGKSVSLSTNGRILAIGARRNDGSNREDAGHVRVWRYDGMRWVQRGSDIDGEGAGDESGWASDISGDGNIVAIGAYLNNNGAGHVRVYRFENDWVQMGQDIDGDSPNDQAGYSVSLSEDGLTVAIGIHFDGIPGQARLGSAKVYRYNNNNNNNNRWEQLGSTVFGTNAGDLAGVSVALSGDASELVVGATHESNGNTGSVKVYKFKQRTIIPRSTSSPVGTQQESQQPAGVPVTTAPPSEATFLWAPRGSRVLGAAPGDLFGQSLCLSADGNTMVVGASGIQRDAPGFLRVLSFSASNWSPRGSQLTQPSTTDFGWSCALSNDGNRVAVGDWLYSGGAEEGGAVWTFDWDESTNDWVPYGDALQGDGGYDRAGWSVAYSAGGEILAVGSPGNDDENGLKRNSGTVKVYGRNGLQWTQIGRDIRGEATLDEAGQSVSLSNDGMTVVVGARLNDGAGVNAGHVRVYRLNGSNWEQVGNDIDGERSGNEFGWSSSLSGNGRRVAVGAYLNSGNGFRAGHTRVYQYDDSTNRWIQMGDDLDGDSVNSDFGFAVALSNDGSTLAVGAPRNSNSVGGERAGAAQVYRYDGQVWNRIGEVLLGTSPGDMFGYVVALSSDGAVLGVGANQEMHSEVSTGYALTYQLQ